MLILTRRPGQRVTIAPQPELDPATRAHELFCRPLEIVVVQAIGNEVRVGINADPRLLILREELIDDRYLINAALIRKR